jgi:hypothetical protein
VIRPFLVVCTAGLIWGCQGTVDCSCRVDGLIVSNGEEVRELTVGGPACADATIVSSGIPADAAAGAYQVDWFVPYAAGYYIKPKRSGDCSVHMVMRDGSAGDTTVPMWFSEPGTGCCSGTAFTVNSDPSLHWSSFTWQPVDAGID